MSVSLSKGGNISLSKSDPGLRRILIGLGWSERATDGPTFDLDASAFLVASSGKVRSDSDFVFYGQLKSPDGSVEHMGDNLTGDGDGDDEEIKVDLTKVPSNVDKIVIVVTIHDFEAKRQNFGMVKDAYIRILNSETNVEITRFDLAEDSSTETALSFGEVYRHGAEWKFRAVAQGYAGGLRALALSYGVNVA